jgi:hypothetical protein
MKTTYPIYVLEKNSSYLIKTSMSNKQISLEMHELKIDKSIQYSESLVNKYIYLVLTTGLGYIYDT